jgi:hypothetical protein
VFGKVRADEFVPVWRRLQCNPDHAHLGAAVGIERDEGGVGTLANEATCGVVEFHALLYGCASRFIPATPW